MVPVVKMRGPSISPLSTRTLSVHVSTVSDDGLGATPANVHQLVLARKVAKRDSLVHSGASVGKEGQLFPGGRNGICPIPMGMNIHETRNDESSLCINHFGPFRDSKALSDELNETSLDYNGTALNDVSRLIAGSHRDKSSIDDYKDISAALRWFNLFLHLLTGDVESVIAQPSTLALMVRVHLRYVDISSDAVDPKGRWIALDSSLTVLQLINLERVEIRTCTKAPSESALS